MPLRLTPAQAAALTGHKLPGSSSSKYRNARTTVDSDTFDSKLEARRWHELLLLERCGQIRELRRQVRYELIPPVRLKGAKRLTPGIDYVADFQYVDMRQDRLVIEDAKSKATAGIRVFKLKRHLMKALLGLDIDIYPPG